MRIKPKKRLGQNFLIDKNIARMIIDALELKPSDIVLEIGAGRGELSCLIAQRTARLYALEIDKELLPQLKESLRGCFNTAIINKDILRFNFKKHFSGPGYRKKRIKVFGNIPYYISSPIIEQLLKYRGKIDSIFITVQREFARRIVASPGSKEYGSFSCFVQYYAEPKIILNIKKTCFFPRPKVDSSLLRLKIRQNPGVGPKDEGLFFKIIRSAFNKRRKTLRNSLKGIVPPSKLERFFNKYGIDSFIRPEELSLADFANLSNT